MIIIGRRAIPVAALCVAPLCLLHLAHAMSPDPAQAAPGALLQYRSAFAGYKPLADAQPGNWRVLNDAVKDDGMAGMADDGAGMQGTGNPPGHAMPMPMPMPMRKAPSSARLAKARSSTPPASAANPAGMPAMDGMPGMSGHAGHAMPGGKP